MTSSLYLKEKPTLADFQQYVREMVEERGFKKETIAEMFLLFQEECGELAKAVRKSSGLHTDPNSQSFMIGEELADILMYLLDISNHFDIDLEDAFRRKEEMNKKRVWKKLP